MNRNLIIVQQYLSWKGHYRQYFENLHHVKYKVLYVSNNPEIYENAKWIKSDFVSEKPFTIQQKIKGRFLNSYKIFKYLSSASFDVIHLIEFEPLTYLLFANKLSKNARFLITIHSSDKLHFSNWFNNWISGLQRRILNLALNKAVRSGAIFVTHYHCHKESIIGTIGEQFRNRVNVIEYPAPNPDSDKIKIPSQQNGVLTKYLIYGQIREDKGIYEFLQNESTKELKITIAGKILDQRILEFSDRTNLTIIDKFLDESEILDLVKNHDFMLLPYPPQYTNGAGTFKDSLAKAMPVVCSSIPIFQEIITKHQVGILFDHPSEIVKKVGKLSSSEYEEISKNCLRYAYTYDWKYMKNEYYKLYESLLDTKV
jgi:glycosyltransferase involved in cell wall biosynthesis